MGMTELKKARFLREVKQIEVWKATGILNVKLSYLENGYSKPTPEEKQKLSKYFGIPEKELFPEVKP